MSTSRFVSGSSIILAGWLGATFLNEVPAQRYPKLDKKSVPTAVNVTQSSLLIANQEKPEAVSLAH